MSTITSTTSLYNTYPQYPKSLSHLSQDMVEAGNN
jgi:hypothetical protein